MHHFHSRRTSLKLRIGGLLLIIKLLCGAAVLPLFAMGLLLGRRDLLVTTLGLLLAGAVVSVFHFALSRDVCCPLCKGSLLRSQGCAYHSKARRFLGSRRLGVALPALFRGRFRCPYCGEQCSCSPRTRRCVGSNSTFRNLGTLCFGLLFLGFSTKAPAAIVSLRQSIFTSSPAVTAPSKRVSNTSGKTEMESELLMMEMGLSDDDFSETPGTHIEWTLPPVAVPRSAILPPSWQLSPFFSNADGFFQLSPLTTTGALRTTAVPEPRAYFLFILGLLMIFLHRCRPRPSPRRFRP